MKITYWNMDYFQFLILYKKYFSVYCRREYGEPERYLSTKSANVDSLRLLLYYKLYQENIVHDESSVLPCPFLWAWLCPLCSLSQGALQLYCTCTPCLKWRIDSGEIQIFVLRIFSFPRMYNIPRG